METDRELLDAYIDSRSEPAFRALVDRHLDLVHSVARRVTLNDDLARDVSQNVFLLLATRPETVPPGIKLLAWLHRTARHRAIDLVRSENRRKRREQISSQEQQIAMTDEPLDWKELEPVLDSALERLPETDRALILSRFYQRRSHADAAHELGISEDAARMRTKRALEKLRSSLGKRGITTTAALLGATVAANAIQPAPAGLATSICSGSMAAASTAATAGGAGAFGFGKATLATLAAAAVAVPVILVQSGQKAELKKDIARLEQQLQRSSTSTTSPPPPETTRPRGSASDRSASRSLDEILAMRDPLQRMRELVAYAEAIDPAMVPTALAALRENTPEWDPDGKIAAQILLKRWAAADMDAALAFISALDYREATGAATTVLSTLAARDPQRAIAWLEAPENTLAKSDWMRDALTGTITKEWVRRDPAAALAWAEANSGTGRKGALIGVFGTLAATDPEQAARLASQLRADQARTDVIGQIAQAWAERAPLEAIAWSQELEGGDHTRGMAETLGTWAATAPEQAAAFVDRWEGDRQDFLPGIGISWAQRDPQAAADWLASQPEGEGRTVAMGAVMWAWTVADPAASSTWLRELPPGPDRDQAIGGLAKAAFDDDPQAAITWAASVDNPERRAQALEIGVREWLRRDPAAATSWLQSTDVLSRSESARLLGRPGGE